MCIGRSEGRSPPLTRDTCGIAPWYDEPIAELEAIFRNREFPQDSQWLTEETEFDMSRSIGDNRGVHRGISNLEAVFRSFMAAWEKVDWKVTSVEELDDGRLLVTTRVRTRGRASDVETEARGASVWEFEDRRLVRWTMFQSRDQALQELGSEE